MDKNKQSIEPRKDNEKLPEGAENENQKQAEEKPAAVGMRFGSLIGAAKNKKKK